MAAIEQTGRTQCRGASHPVRFVNDEIAPADAAEDVKVLVQDLKGGDEHL